MSRRSIVKKRYRQNQILHTIVTLVSLLTVRVLKSGKKRLANSIVLETFAIIQENFK